MSSEDETDVCLSQRNELSVPSEVMTAAGDADAAVAEFSHPHFVPTDERKFDVQVMVYNVAKRTNIGNMVRSAVAFGASAVIGTFYFHGPSRQRVTHVKRRIHHSPVHHVL
jgi:tRNA G18 (ribose-2'-O)-methylase SpoU